MRRRGNAASGGRRHGQCVSGGPGKERYIVFDERYVGTEDLPGRSLMRAVLGLGQSRTPKEASSRHPSGGAGCGNRPLVTNMKHVRTRDAGLPGDPREGFT